MGTLVNLGHYFHVRYVQKSAKNSGEYFLNFFLINRRHFTQFYMSFIIKTCFNFHISRYFGGKSSLTDFSDQLTLV